MSVWVNQLDNMRSFMFASVVLCCVVLITSCSKDTCTATRTYTQWNPVFLSTEEMIASCVLESPKKLLNPGKIYVYGDYLLINEINEGIHIINNAEAHNPIPVGFLSIKGNVDMAIKNDILYADNYTNILAINITDIRSPKLLEVKHEVYTLFGKREDGKFLVGYQPTEITVTEDCNRQLGGGVWLEGGVFFDSSPTKFSGKSNGVGMPTGIGGSFARFTIVDDVLYIVDHSNLNTISLNDKGGMTMMGKQSLQWEVETIFAAQEKLFIGTKNGMIVYGIENPIAPQYLSEFSHRRACDPVFVSDNIAYVTLRSGNTCDGFQNQLDILDITDIQNIVLIKSVPMTNPHGLSMYNDKMIICEGEHGFRTLEIADEGKNVIPLTFNQSQDSYDVIMPKEDVAIIVGKNGLFQWEIKKDSPVKLLSRIQVTR